MTPQRLAAAVIAATASVAMLLLVAFSTLPFVAYAPGPTINVLGDANGSPIVMVSGHKTYPTSGQLRLTTVSVSSPAPPGKAQGKSFFNVLQAWLDPSEAVYPYDVVYPDNESPQQSQTDGRIEMVGSQDNAKAIALRALGYKIPAAVEVSDVSADSPADGKLEVRDLIVKADGKTVGTDTNVVIDAITGTATGQPVDLTVVRDKKTVDVSIIPKDSDGTPKIGISLGEGYQFPFSVSVDIGDNIGGPSAGLMFSLGIYDTLTPGALTGGAEIAGTGEMNPDGTVGAIGGIQQKIAGSHRDGAALFLVPAANCQDTVGAHPGSMRLVKVDTFKSALSSIQAYAADHDAKLPTCGSGS